MRETVRLTSGSARTRNREITTAMFWHTVAAVCGFTAARAAVLDALLPFGLAFLAGVASSYMPATAIGVFLGYFIPAMGEGTFRYIAAMFAIIAIRLLVNAVVRFAENPIFLSLICLASNALTAAVTLTGLPFDILKVIGEAVISSGGAYFVCKACKALRKNRAGLSGDELSALLITISMLLVGVSSIRIGGISLGSIIAVFIILVCARYGAVLGGAVSGIALSFSMILSGQADASAVLFALGGLLAGIFAVYGKYLQMSALLFCSLIAMVTGGITESTVIQLVETALGSVVFLVLPRSFGVVVGKLFSAYPKISAPTGVKKALMLRLKLASSALNDVSQTVEQVSRELSRINSPDFSGVISGIEQEACAGCKLRIYCWETKRDDTVNTVLEMTKAIKNGGGVSETIMPEAFKGRCLRVGAMERAVIHNYSSYTSKIAAENRVDEVRSVVSDQFDGISSMFRDMALELENDGRFDNASAELMVAALKNINIYADECSCYINSFGRMSVECRIKNTKGLTINKRHVMKLLSLCSERDFDIPEITETGDDVFITLNERAAFAVNLGVHQISAGSSVMCGDAYHYFKDGKGHLLLILSDGMGTGGRAAVDSAMASGLMSRLLKAGFGYDCALRILNSSMLFKSTDESLATLDIVSVDLHTGVAELYKAGAAPTLVRRSGRTGRAESTSLPVGILREIGFDRAGIKLRPNDIILMMSDGVTSEGTDWIRSELEAWQDGNAQSLAEHICECAQRRRSDSHEDDITVLAAILEEAV